MTRIVARAEMLHRLSIFIGIASGIFLASCGTPTALPPTSTPEPSPINVIPTVAARLTVAMPTAPKPTTANSAIPEGPVVLPWVPSPLQTSSESGTRVDLDKIFPAGEGRALTIAKCTFVCHRIGAIVRGQRIHARWEAIQWSHRGKTGLGNDDDLKTIFDYLEANFNPSHPEPDLPPWYLLEEDSPEW